MDLKALLTKNAQIDARIAAEKEQARIGALKAELDAAKPKRTRKAKPAVEEPTDGE